MSETYVLRTPLWNPAATIGHFLDQKRLKQGLYRHPWDDIAYVMPEQYSSAAGASSGGGGGENISGGQ